MVPRGGLSRRSTHQEDGAFGSGGRRQVGQEEESWIRRECSESGGSRSKTFKQGGSRRRTCEKEDEEAGGRRRRQEAQGQHMSSCCGRRGWGQARRAARAAAPRSGALGRTAAGRGRPPRPPAAFRSPSHPFHFPFRRSFAARTCTDNETPAALSAHAGRRRRTHGRPRGARRGGRRGPARLLARTTLLHTRPHTCTTVSCADAPGPGVCAPAFRRRPPRAAPAGADSASHAGLCLTAIRLTARHPPRRGRRGRVASIFIRHDANTGWAGRAGRGTCLFAARRFASVPALTP